MISEERDDLRQLFPAWSFAEKIVSRFAQASIDAHNTDMDCCQTPEFPQCLH